MGVYTPDKICDDFNIVMKGINNNIVEKLKLIALDILELLPDKAPRDLAISNLLESAEMIRNSIIFEASKRLKEE